MEMSPRLRDCTCGIPGLLDPHAKDFTPHPYSSFLLLSRRHHVLRHHDLPDFRFAQVQIILDFAPAVPNDCLGVCKVGLVISFLQGRSPGFQRVFGGVCSDCCADADEHTRRLYTRRLWSLPSPSEFTQLHRTKPSVQSRPLQKCQYVAWLPQGGELVSKQQRIRLLLARRYSAHDACPGRRLDASVCAVLIEAREVKVMLQRMRKRFWLALSIRSWCVRWRYYVAKQAVLQRPCSLSRRGVIVGLCALDKGIHGVEGCFETGGRVLDEI
jgi:hypothetical protein